LRTRYGKASADVIPEFLDRLRQDAALLELQKGKAACHRSGVPRPHCLLCRRSFEGAQDRLHRDIPYRVCGHCDHWQTRFEPSADEAFEQIYPDLSPEAFDSRVARVYQPKLEWILNQADLLGLSAEALLSKAWIELGSGSGYFLKALRDGGARNVLGLERNPALCRQAKAHVHELQQHFVQPLHHALQINRADVWVAFFVIEHVADPAAFWEAVRALPERSVVVFSVPVVGFAVRMEGAFDHFFARILESVVHTQMYTHASLHYALQVAGLSPKASWTFGQDIQDLWRMLLVKARAEGVHADLPRLQEILFSLTDPLQAILDQHLLADSMHVLCVRE
jgi:2-polyprenyl-3-methyl-5-hydroxy-6-metoxy-1,4-benzoquinol methylase